MQPTGTYDAYDAGSASLTGLANREDLADIIYDISPTETPFITMAQRGSARNAKTEWLIDELATPASNFQLEGDDYTGEVRAAPVRAYTYTQISAKALTIAGSQEVIDKAGRKSEIAYQTMRQARELKRDMERHAVGYSDDANNSEATNITGVAGDGESYPNQLGASSGATGARVTANVHSWIATNADVNGATLAHVGSGTVLADDANTSGGTERALVESALKTVIRNTWDEGGNPTTIIVDAFNKQVISAFTGGTTRFDKSEDKRLVTAIDIYVSDFGDHTVYPDRFMTNVGTTGTAALILDMNYWAIVYLRPFQQTPLAKTGDAEKRLILTEWGICSKNERASGSVYNIADS